MSITTATRGKGELLIQQQSGDHTITNDDVKKDYGARMDPNKKNCVIGIPEYHDNLFRHLQKREDWLKDLSSDNHYSFKKEVKTPEDLTILNQLIKDLRTEKSELFIDQTFHKKPLQLPTREYISEFLRIKGIFSYYSFNRWFKVTVYPESGGLDLDTEQPIKKGEKMEYLFVPLLIRLKKNKIFEQFKSINYLNASGTEFEVKSVNPKHFMRDDISKFNQKEKLRENTLDSSNSKHLVYSEPLHRNLENDFGEEENE